MVAEAKHQSYQELEFSCSGRQWLLAEYYHEQIKWGRTDSIRRDLGGFEEGAARAVAAGGCRGRRRRRPRGSARGWAPLRCVQQPLAEEGTTPSPGRLEGARICHRRRVHRIGWRGGRAPRMTGGDGGGRREEISSVWTIWAMVCLAWAWIGWAVA